MDKETSPGQPVTEPCYPPQQLAPQYGAHSLEEHPPRQLTPAYQTQGSMQRGIVAPANLTEWNNNLLNCSPCSSCCLGTFLPCVLLGKTADRMRDSKVQSGINWDCFLFTVISTGCGWIYIKMKRSEIRERFGIAGSGTGDCCATYCCPCCALIQQDNEVKTRIWHSVNAQGYQPQPGMGVPK